MAHEPYVKSLPLMCRRGNREFYYVPGSAPHRRDPGYYLMVVTDSVHLHGVTHRSHVPGQGEIQLASQILWAKEVLWEGIRTNLLAYGEDIYRRLPTDREYPADLHLRAAVMESVDALPVRFTYWGMLIGNLLVWYREGDRGPHDLKLPPGLDLMSRFDEPVFAPTDLRHADHPVSAEAAAVEYAEAFQLGEHVFYTAAEYASYRGAVITEASFRIGYNRSGELCLADEWLTDGCAGFVSASHITPGGDQIPWLGGRMALIEDTIFLQQCGFSPDWELYLREPSLEAAASRERTLFRQLFDRDLSQVQQRHLALAEH